MHRVILARWQETTAQNCSIFPESRGCFARETSSRGEDFNVRLGRFALERLLYRRCRSKHREQFALKGGMRFALWEPPLHRLARALALLGFGRPSASPLDAEALAPPDGEMKGIALLQGTVRARIAATEEAVKKVNLMLELQKLAGLSGRRSGVHFRRTPGSGARRLILIHAART